jgi:hypothetical protein
MRKLRALIELGDVAQESPQHLGVLAFDGAGRGHLDRMVVEVGHSQIVQQRAAIGMRIGAHSPVAGRRKCRQLRHQTAVVIEQFLGFVAAHPVVKERHVGRVCGVHEQGHLVGAKGSLDRQTVDHFGSRPALGRS